MKQNNRMTGFLFVGLGIVIILFMIGNAFNDEPEVLDWQHQSSSWTTSSGSVQTSVSETRTSVPWDYKIEQAKVGDLIGADMVILPNNELLPNDQNYATGDNVWVLQHMTAEMLTDPNGRNDVTMSSWRPIKSYKSEAEAKSDLENLKLSLQTEVDLVGVYKTEFEGKFRHFAVIKLPTGHHIKQPIAEDRYTAMKDKKQVKVTLEEVHDYADYDLAMAKFRGWAE
ncbi:hypothetical protein [Paenibacillus turpanensis]|uniref:hypothetical protein n=1 Tax=Paenibacillus turpanensis TaxID=2689078 RepID=UPI001FB6184C|nr:hypothetical protein [Paenibacillus turpanensis]